MLTRIGGGPSRSDVVDLLVECHGRIRSFLDLARRLAEARGLPEREVAEAAEAVRRYFAVALPLHARDEEDSILPRLRGLDPEVDAALEAMRREHAEHGEPVGRLVALCGELAASPRRLPDLAPHLALAVDALARHFAEHLRREEQIVFPAIRRLVDAATDARIREELRARRTGSSHVPAVGP